MADNFSVIIIGAGPAGSTAAMLLARAGLDVLLIERAETPGGKNMFGGRMYSFALNRLIPDFWEEAPLERPVVRETVTMLAGGRSMTMTFQEDAWSRPPYHSFTLLRAEFDAWLAGKAEEAGAMLACGIRVDDVLLENGRVIGVRAGDDELLADVVIAADGANSLITEQAGLRASLAPRQLGTGVKQVIELPAETISQRFQLAGNSGAAQMYVGAVTKGLQGGGFLYTNKTSISLGLVVNTAVLSQNQHQLSELLEDFKERPEIAPLIEGGRVAEYSAHLVPEAGLNMMPRLFGDGILVVGDAAGFVLNLGYLVRGMDLAIGSGEAAAQAVLAAKAKGDFTKAGLSVYQEMLKKGFVWRDLDFYRQSPHFLETQRLYGVYPELATGIGAGLFTVSEAAPAHLLGRFMAELKANQIGLAQLAGDAWKGGRAL